MKMNSSVAVTRLTNKSQPEVVKVNLKIQVTHLNLVHCNRFSPIMTTKKLIAKSHQFIGKKICFLIRAKF